MKNERYELNDKEMENVSGGGTDNNYAYPTIVACKGPDGWEEPKYIIGSHATAGTDILGNKNPGTNIDFYITTAKDTEDK